MTRQKAIKIAKDKITRCTSFLADLKEMEKENPDTDSLCTKLSLIVKILVTREIETLQKIIEQIDSKKPAKPL